MKTGKRRWIASLFGILGLLSCPVPVYAGSNADPLESLSEEMLLLQEIPSVYGASKYEQKVTEAPSSVSIVTSEEIRKYGYRTLADILRSLRGFYITYDRNYHYVGLRGFSRPGDYNSRILLLVDGHRLNDNIYGQAFVGTDFILDVDVIDRVEVIRGPSSSLYGTNAFFGVVNVITKRGRDLQGAEISGETASFGTNKARLSYGNRFGNGLEMLLSGSFYNSDGPERLYYKEFDEPGMNNGIARWRDHDRSYSFFSDLSCQGFTLHGAFINRQKGIPTAPWDIVFDHPDNQTTDVRAYVDLAYEHDFGNDLKAETRLYYDYYDFEGEYVWDWADPGDPPDLVRNRDKARGEFWGGELQITKRLLDKHKFIVGAEYRDNVRQDQKNGDVEPDLEYFKEERSSLLFAFYAQGEYQIFQPLILNLGVRYDHYETFGDTTNPRIALIYNPSETTTFKFLFGQAFRAPSAYELYYNDGNDTQKANPDLEPERIRTYELVYEQALGERLRLVTSGFLYRIDALITETLDPSDGLLVFRNVDEVEAKGFEVELEGRWPSGLEGRIAYTLQQAEDLRTGQWLTNSPEFLARFNLIVPLVTDKFFAGTEVQYVSRRSTISGNLAEGYLLANFTLFCQNLPKGLEASASVYNLFNETYKDPGSEAHTQDTIEQDGRTFRFKLTYRF